MSENAAPAIGEDGNDDNDDDVINDDSGRLSGDPLAAMRRRRAAAQQDKKTSNKRSQDNAPLLALDPQFAKVGWAGGYMHRRNKLMEKERKKTRALRSRILLEGSFFRLVATDVNLARKCQFCTHVCAFSVCFYL